ncbi:hypothetical protein CMO90_01675 [Candidatus Woesearchaeota archaeon]|jgi:hypothetical protein|nr:hypothetical protein [Candidatus Woesearchaeota archaeon]
MLKPDYNNCLVNLMSSISKSFDVDNPYNPLDINIKGKNVVLLVLDGLGYEYLLKHGKNSFLGKHLFKKMTSVFPPTTASGIMTFLTGVAPEQHASIGWYTYLKELGVVSTILPFHPRYGGESFEKIGLSHEDVIGYSYLSDRIKASFFNIMPKEIAGYDYKKGRKTTLTYTTMNKFFTQIKKAVNAHNRRKYIYAYWPKFDSLCHEFGVKSKLTKEHFKELDNKISLFLETLKDTNTTFLITADHGLIDSTKSNVVDLKKHPELLDCLVMPLSGDSRTKYCFVRPSKEREFERYVKKNLKNYCHIFKSEELVKKNFFGLFEPDKKLFERIGDYTLILKENYVMNDPILGKESHFNIGNHGGLSKEELYVPLIILNI